MNGLDARFFESVGTSFADFVHKISPDLLPRPHSIEAPHGTTIVALSYQGGVLMAGDRRATMGNLIASRDIEKVFVADEYSVVGIAGTAGLAVELVKLFQVELEHYEKIEGSPLSLDGKANRLASLIRGNLPLAMQGLAVVPLLVGFDPDSNIGRIFSYDVTGGRYEESSFHAVGSGSIFARGALKKIYQETFTREESILASLAALYDAADDDSATGGPDLARNIYPLIITVSREGASKVSDEEVERLSRQLVESRTLRPDGPKADLV